MPGPLPTCDDAAGWYSPEDDGSAVVSGVVGASAAGGATLGMGVGLRQWRHGPAELVRARRHPTGQHGPIDRTGSVFVNDTDGSQDVAMIVNSYEVKLHCGLCCVAGMSRVDVQRRIQGLN